LMSCGIPAVTLAGERHDWEKLLAKADKLRTYGPLVMHWYSLLKPVLQRFLHTFDQPTAASTSLFWSRIAHHHDEGSGSLYLSGWLTAFCFFDREGVPLARTEETWSSAPDGNANILQLDGVHYPRIHMNQIPPAYASVPVLLINPMDNGKLIKTTIVAGCVGTKILHSGLTSAEHDGMYDTVEPASGWWMFEDSDQTESSGKPGGTTSRDKSSPGSGKGSSGSQTNTRRDSSTDTGRPENGDRRCTSKRAGNILASFFSVCRRSKVTRSGNKNLTSDRHYDCKPSCS
jgi:hypothetical protein